MDQFEISELADWLEAHHDQLLDKAELMPVAKVQAAVDYLQVLAAPAQSYLARKQGAYDQDESDHKLNLLADEQPVFEGGYQPKKDLNIVKFGLEVIGAVATTGHLQTVTAALSKDAVVTLVVASARFRQWQEA